jgi:hypothetical protein
MAREEIRGSTSVPMVKWDDVTPGTAPQYQGLLKGTRPSPKIKDSLLADLLLDDGTELTLPCGAVLRDRISKVASGDYVYITYLGWKDGAPGRPRYRDFKVQREVPDAAPVTAPVTAEADDDTAVPF